MFKYEEMDFKTLCNAEDIDPDSADALYALAQFCRTGKGVPASQEMYEKYLRSAAQAGSEAAEQELQQLNGAPAAHKTAQAPTSLTELIHSAERGTPDALIPAADACARMGEPERAVQFLQRAADLIGRKVYTEEECQQIWLKLAKLWGKDQLNKPEECHRAYGMAAELHNAEAAAAYAKQCREGYGCEVDEEKALHYEMISAERGGAVRKYELAIRLMAKNKRMDAAMMLEQGMDCSEDPGMKHACGLMLAFLGVGTLTPETAQWAWDHAEGNSIKTNAEEEGKEHEIRIPLEYLTRLYGTPEQARAAGLPFDAKQAAALSNADDPAVATAWMEEAADLGDTTVYNQLGYNYACGNGVPQNTAKAFYWFQKGAEAGDADSQRNLGVCYEQGNGVPADMKQAVYWYTKAADQGQAEAQNDLGICCLKGLGMEVDLPRAIALFHKAAEGGSAMAEYNLGVAYRDGSGVGVDLQQALQWFQRAASHDYKKAWAEIEPLRRKMAQTAASQTRADVSEPQPEAKTAAAPAFEKKSRGKWQLPLLIVILVTVVWLVPSVIRGILPGKTTDTAGGTQPAAAASSSTDDPNTIDPFDESFFNQEGGVELHFNGISPNGTLTIYNNLPSDNPASQIVYEADRYEGISDQQNITITATLDSSEYRLETKTLVVKADVDSHYLTALDELNADAWSQIKAALDEVVLANIGTPDANGVYGPNDNRNLNELDGHSMENSTLYNLTYKSCILLNAKNPDDLGYKQPTCRLIIEYTVDYDFVPIVSRYDSYTGTGISGCIYVDNLIVDGDGNAEVDSSQFGMDNELYKDSVDFENEWVSPRVTDYTVSRMDAAQVMPQ
ncbi:MAG TPA: sel1 repeat family protein [Candidatus Gemmiger faecavium]|nr:sel1 repeat family protein [Candidatus Gemmiger faecavium]